MLLEKVAHIKQGGKSCIHLPMLASQGQVQARCSNSNCRHITTAIRQARLVWSSIFIPSVIPCKGTVHKGQPLSQKFHLFFLATLEYCGIQEGNRRRKIEATDANAASSRSHAILEVTVCRSDRNHYKKQACNPKIPSLGCCILHFAATLLCHALLIHTCHAPRQSLCAS